MFEVSESNLCKRETKNPYLGLAKLQFPYNHNFHLCEINNFQNVLLQFIERLIHIMIHFSSSCCNREILTFLLLLVSHTWSFRTTNHRVHFIDALTH